MFLRNVGFYLRVCAAPKPTTSSGINTATYLICLRPSSNVLMLPKHASFRVIRARDAVCRGPVSCKLYAIFHLTLLGPFPNYLYSSPAACHKM
jgi:hypothetical protein